MTRDRHGEVVSLLVDLIRNRCVNDGSPDSGHEHRSVTTLQAFLGAKGEVFEPHPGRQSVLFRIPGTRPGAPRLMLLAHLDVVPANAGEWSVPPFEGVRSDGFVWGRGTVDMLNQTAVMAAVTRRYLSGDSPPLPGDLLFLAVADEESGGRFGAAHLVAQHWDRVATEYLVSETGAPMLSGVAGPGLPVTVAEKGPHWRRLRSRGVPGHGSQPYGAANALVRLAGAIATLGDCPPPARVGPLWRSFVDAWDPEPDLKSALVDPDRMETAIETIAGYDTGLARWVHACTHMTVSPNTMRAGVKMNVVPDLAEAEIDVRLLPGQETADLNLYLATVLDAGPGSSLEIEEVESTLAGDSPAEGPLWDAIGDALDEVTGLRRLLPTMIPVATDARFFRQRGTRCYGFIVGDDRVGFSEHMAMFHGHDERISEGSLALTADHLAATVRRFGEITAS